LSPGPYNRLDTHDVEQLSELDDGQSRTGHARDREVLVRLEGLTELESLERKFDDVRDLLEILSAQSRRNLGQRDRRDDFAPLPTADHSRRALLSDERPEARDDGVPQRTEHIARALDRNLHDHVFAGSSEAVPFAADPQGCGVRSVDGAREIVSL
jgi:hypothetical protein